MDVAGTINAERNVEGMVEMMLDATQNYKDELTEERLFGWHVALFSTGRSGIHKINVGAWREHPMQVTSGYMGKEVVHFQAPEANRLVKEMQTFLFWLNGKKDLDAVIKAAIAHLWFVTIHPFDDGNGRTARAIADLLLARADQSSQRFRSNPARAK
jgi:Fic family protein